ncbi:unnamed protein product [Arabidopsis halleri]
MEVTDERISDCVRVQLGIWSKDESGVWRFKEAQEGTGKSIRFREGDGVDAAKGKVMEAWNIDRTSEKVELTYEMPEWMDIDGQVKPVPIHIVTDDNMDMFLAMRVNIHEMKLYVVQMPLHMTLEIDGFEVVPIMDEFAFAEVMSKKDVENEMKRRADKEAIDDIICTQLPGEHVGDSGDGLLGWVGHSYGAGGFATLSAAMRHYREAAAAARRDRSPQSVLEPESSSSTEPETRVTRLTRDFFSDFERAADPSGEETEDAEPLNQLFPTNAEPAPTVGNSEYCGNTSADPPIEGSVAGMLRLLSLPEQTFARDAAPVLDDANPDEDGGDRTRTILLDVDYEGDELFIGRVFKSRDDCRVKIAVHAINRKFSFRNDRTTNDIVLVRCLYDACPWRVYCIRLESSEYFEIRTAVLDHICPVEVRSQYQRQATTSVISEILKSKYGGGGVGPTPIALRRALLEEYSVNVSYWKA